MRILKFVLTAIVVLCAVGAGGLATRWFLQSQNAAQSDAAQNERRGTQPQATERVIISLQSALERNPYHADAWAQLGAAFLQRVRENGDPTNYARAEQAFRKALELDANHFHAISGMGALALARHQFRDALVWGERGRALNPDNAGIYGVLGDAHLELGEYDAAFANFQKMVDTRPDLASYARVSYARELLGDRAGAVEQMRAAVNAGAARSEARSWALTQLGNLYFEQGDLEHAHRAYQDALDNWSEYPYARAGLARIHAARGDYASAVEIYTRLMDALPLPEFVIALGDAYTAQGDTANAQKQYALVGAMQQLFASNGVDTDAELALFNADHQIDLPGTLALAQRAYAKRPGIFVADTLAWTLYQTGDYVGAKNMMDRALRLQTQNALLFFHAGMIAHELGDDAGAQQYLSRALQLNPHFSLRYAREARELLGTLETERGKQVDREQGNR